MLRFIIVICAGFGLIAEASAQEPVSTKIGWIAAILTADVSDGRQVKPQDLDQVLTRLNALLPDRGRLDRALAAMMLIQRERNTEVHALITEKVSLPIRRNERNAVRELRHRATILSQDFRQLKDQNVFSVVLTGQAAVESFLSNVHAASFTSVQATDFADLTTAIKESSVSQIENARQTRDLFRAGRPLPALLYHGYAVQVPIPISGAHPISGEKRTVLNSRFILDALRSSEGRPYPSDPRRLLVDQIFYFDGDKKPTLLVIVREPAYAQDSFGW